MRRQFKLACVAATIAVAVPASIFSPARAVPADGEPGNATSVGLGHMFYPFSPAPGQQASFPHLALLDKVDAQGQRVPDVWLGYAQGPDSVTNAVPPGVLVSHDGGTSFLDRRDETGVEPLAFIRRSNGEIISPRFIPLWDGTPSLDTRVSSDFGKTWTKRIGKVTPPPGKTFTHQGFDKGLRVHKGAMELPDGRIIVGAYGKFAEDARWSSMMLTTTDGGASWSVWGVINADNSVGTSEVAFSRTKDGRLIAILRGSPESAGLMQSYSSDDGRTWTTPTKVVAPTPTITGAVEPSLVLQPNGVLLLAYGRPGNHLLTSASGNGDDWGKYQLLQDNAPKGNGEATWGTSANMTAISLDSSRTMVSSDTCAPWGCQTYNETYAIWARHVDAVGPGTGKLDLRTLHAQGRVKITGAEVTDANFGQTRLSGMFDGSSEKHAAAKIKPGSSVVVELDQAYSINKLGLLMAPGVKQSANIQVSSDGRAWGKPVVKLRDRVDHAMQYTDIAPTTAKFIKISPDGSAPLDAITELEVYSADTFTFENDPVNAAPRGWKQNSLAQVVDTVPSTNEPRTPGFQSRRALRLLDFATDDSARAKLEFGQRQSATIDYQMMGINRQTGTSVTVGGVDASGKEMGTYHFTLDLIQGTVRQYDGKAWHQIGKLTAPIQPNEWVNVSVAATRDGVSFTLKGQTFRGTVINGPKPVALTSVQFSSTGTAPKGSSILFDNVRVR